MGKTKNSVTVEIPKESAEKISELNDVDMKYVDRTIIKILRDEIDIEEKWNKLQGQAFKTDS